MVHHSTLPQAPIPLLIWLRRPELSAWPRVQLNVWKLLGWVSLILLIMALTGLLTKALSGVLGYHVGSNVAAYLQTHFSLTALAILITAPIMEELSFRAFLSTRPLMIFIGLAFFFYFMVVLARFLLPHASIPPAQRITDYFHGIWVLLPTGLLSLLLWRYARAPIIALFRQYGLWVFWISCLLFGALHAFSLHIPDAPWWIYLILVLPQFSAGVLLGYLRISFGLRWSIAAHLLIDGSVVGLSWLLLAARQHSVVAGDMVHGVILLLAIFALVYGLTYGYRVVRLRA